MAEFSLDEDVSLRLVPVLEALSHDVLAAKRYLPPSTSDHEQFATAVRLGRILVIYNKRDFLLLHRAWLDWFAEWGEARRPRHAGILCLPQPTYLNESAAGAMLDRFVAEMAPSGSLDNRFFLWTRADRDWREIL